MAVAGKRKKIFDDRYEILSIVGRGSRSVVYHARHVDGDQHDVALKVLLAQKQQFSGSDQLRKEALAMVSSRHKYVIRLDDFHSVDDLCYLSMEYAPEADLRKYLMKVGGKLHPEQVELFITQAGEALNFIHLAGILHRDVKPDNILVVDASNIRIGDFGVAVLPGEDSSVTDLQTGVGTMNYMAPEVLAGTGYDQRSDIYALGVVFYEMLSGVHPFEDAPLAQQLEIRKDGKFKSLAKAAPDAPEFLIQTIARAMSFDPQSRFQTGRELVHALNAFKQGIQSPSQDITRVAEKSLSESEPDATPISDQAPSSGAEQQDPAGTAAQSDSEKQSDAENGKLNDSDSQSKKGIHERPIRRRRRRRGHARAASTATEQKTDKEEAPQPEAVNPAQQTGPLPADREIPKDPARSPGPEHSGPALALGSQIAKPTDTSTPVEEPSAEITDRTEPTAPPVVESSPSVDQEPAPAKGATTAAQPVAAHTAVTVKTEEPTKRSADVDRENVRGDMISSDVIVTDEADEEEFVASGAAADEDKPTLDEILASLSPEGDELPTSSARKAGRRTPDISKKTASGNNVQGATRARSKTARKKRGSQKKSSKSSPNLLFPGFIGVVLLALIIPQTRSMVMGFATALIPKDSATTVEVESRETVQLEMAEKPTVKKTDPLRVGEFPALPSGIYSGTATGIMPGQETTITFISLEQNDALTVLVGIPGWTPVTFALSDLLNQKGGSQENKLVVASNGILLRFSGESSNGQISGTITNITTGVKGQWSLGLVQ